MDSVAIRPSASDDTDLDVPAVAALVSAKIGPVAVGDAFETDKSHRAGTELACRTGQSRYHLGVAGIKFEVLFHIQIVRPNAAAGKRESRFFLIDQVLKPLQWLSRQLRVNIISRPIWSEGWNKVHLQQLSK